MNKGWKEIVLDEFIDFNPRESIKKGQLSKKVAMDCLKEFQRSINSYALEEFTSGTKFKNGDTLLARITPCLQNGKSAYVDILEDNEIAFGSTEYIVFREKKNVSDKLFLYYLAIYPELRNVAMQSMTGSSGRQRVQIDVLKNSIFNLPPLAEQKAIAKILGDLDAKIELNRKMNETLEAMAQALFQSWFVDFDPVIDNALKAGHAIPEALQHKAEIRKEVIAKRHAELDSASHPELPKDIQNLFPNAFEYNENLDKWIPEGWEVVKFDNVVEVKYGKDHKKLGEGVFPCYGSGGIMRYVNETICNKETVLIPRKGTLTNLMYVRKPFWSVDTMFFTTYKEANFVKYIFYFLQKFNFLEMNVGSAVPSMTTKVLNSLDLIKPTTKILECFEREVEMFLSKKESNTTQSESLIKQRDTLLPQLISGKLKLPQSLVLQMDTELDKETKKII
ncbi:restriction endonuclease subunit S [Formosa sp. PL04]|uniref:restriction endonuclease subunit S n=1 Tax=Formosa sp. PL04 TaxID=3081755 RepID=UPI0029825B8B|nr:restriction endonuclease subunit S [Formosa sp. PL04]MDW5290921.1 restriction endonuclease subunit S [Formosa sp. PL04]